MYFHDIYQNTNFHKIFGWDDIRPSNLATWSFINCPLHDFRIWPMISCFSSWLYWWNFEFYFIEFAIVNIVYSRTFRHSASIITNLRNYDSLFSKIAPFPFWVIIVIRWTTTKEKTSEKIMGRTNKNPSAAV